MRLETQLLEEILDTAGLFLVLSGLVLVLLLEQLLEHLAGFHTVLGRHGGLVDGLLQVEVNNVSISSCNKR